MSAKHTLAGVAFALVLIAAPAAGASTATHATLMIRHQVHGCHAWSVDGSAYKPLQVLALRHGGTLVVTDDDVMSHTLVETNGPSVRIAHPDMARMGATVRITFTHPGTYRFTTKPGEDYMKGVETIGADNVLRLTVNVH
jgi:plastocyanin